MADKVDVISPIERSTMIVRLPSRGKFYKDETMKAGQVEVSAMRLSDEAIFRNLAIQNKTNEALAALVSRCVTAPRTFLREILLPIDEYFILLAIRAVTYGPEYTFRWTCPSCGENTSSTVNILEELKVKTPPDDIEEPISYSFPSGKSSVSVRFLTVKDFDDIRRYQATLKETERYKSDIYTYALQTVKINDVSVDNMPLEDIMNFWANLPASDVRAFDKFINEISPDVDTTIEKSCSNPNCQYVFRGEMPFTAEFFQPSDT